MAKSVGSFLSESARQAAHTCKGGWKVLVHKGPSQFQFWLIALMIGIAAGFAALGFRKGITWLQSSLYGTDDLNRLHSFAESMPWYMLLIIPTVGGLAVGLILHRFTPDGRVRSVADVIEGAALHKGRVEVREGLASALASLMRCVFSVSPKLAPPLWPTKSPGTATWRPPRARAFWLASKSMTRRQLISKSYFY